jgi:hypothetical protein
MSKRDERGLDKNALDNWITGNYGEDQFTHDHDLCVRCHMYPAVSIHDLCYHCSGGEDEE